MVFKTENWDETAWIVYVLQCPRGRQQRIGATGDIAARIKELDRKEHVGWVLVACTQALDFSAADSIERALKRIPGYVNQTDIDALLR